MSVAGPYTFNLVNNSGLDSTNYSVRVLGYSVASQLILQPSANAGALQWGPLPTGVTLPATLANGSDTITFGNGLPAFTAVSVGDSISGSGIPAGTTITAISAEVTLNQAATSSANAPATIEAVILVGGVATKGSTEVTGLIPPPSVSNLRVGQTVIGTGIPAGTTLSQIDGANLQITLSASATEQVSYSNTTPLTFCANVEGAFTTDGTAATLSSITATDQLTVNAAITSTAIPANTTVSQINSITITLSNAATSSGGSDLTFTPIQTATLTSGSGTVSVGAPNVLGTGRRLSGSGIPPGSTITSIDTTGSITVSNAATEAGQQSLTFWPATGVIPSFDIDEYTTFDFDPSTQTAGLNGARIYFFVVPGDWPSVASQPGFIGFPTNPPAFSYVYAVGLGVTQANDPPNSPSTTSSYPPFAIVEPTVDAASAGGGLHIDVQTVDGFTFPLSLTLLDSGNNSLGTVGQPVPAGNVVRSAIIEAYQAAYPSPSAYAALVYGGSSDIDGQYPGILNPGAYLADTSSAGSTLATVWNPVLTQLFNGTNVLNMVGDDSDYYQGTPSTVTTSGQTCNVIQFIGYTDTGMTQPNGNTFNIYSPLTPDPMAPNLSAGCQVFANDGVFHDVSSNVIVASSKVGRSATPPQVALGLQRDIVSALNRGVALEGPSGTTNRSAGDTSYYWAVETNWYPYTTTDTVNTHVQNNFSLFMHTAAVNSAPIFTQPTGAVATPQSLTMGMAYGFAYDEDPVHASSSAGSQPTVPSKFDPAPPGTATVTITVGPWSAS